MHHPDSGRVVGIFYRLLSSLSKGIAFLHRKYDVSGTVHGSFLSLLLNTVCRCRSSLPAKIRTTQIPTTEDVVQEMGMMAKRFEKPSSSQPARIAIQPKAAVKAVSQSTSEDTSQTSSPDRDSAALPDKTRGGSHHRRSTSTPTMLPEEAGSKRSTALSENVSATAINRPRTRQAALLEHLVMMNP